jgi:hypothetical protein
VASAQAADQQAAASVTATAADLQTKRQALEAIEDAYLQPGAPAPVASPAPSAATAGSK